MHSPNDPVSAYGTLVVTGAKLGLDTGLEQVEVLYVGLISSVPVLEATQVTYTVDKNKKHVNIFIWGTDEDGSLVPSEIPTTVGYIAVGS